MEWFWLMQYYEGLCNILHPFCTRNWPLQKFAFACRNSLRLVWFCRIWNRFCTYLYILPLNLFTALTCQWKSVSRFDSILKGSTLPVRSLSTEAMDKYKYLKIEEVKPFVYSVQLNRPDKMNALNKVLWLWVPFILLFIKIMQRVRLD